MRPAICDEEGREGNFTKQNNKKYSFNDFVAVIVVIIHFRQEVSSFVAVVVVVIFFSITNIITNYECSKTIYIYI